MFFIYIEALRGRGVMRNGEDRKDLAGIHEYP